jgi:hypothetical protein
MGYRKKMAYYRGGKALYKLSIFTKENDKELYHEFCIFLNGFLM